MGHRAVLFILLGLALTSSTLSTPLQSQKWFVSRVHHSPSSSQAPEQVHMKMVRAPTTIAVSWVTQSPTPTSELLIGEDETNLRVVTGSSFTFHNDEEDFAYPTGRNFTIHNALIEGLKPYTAYKYKVGSAAVSYSDLFSFETLGSTDKPYTVAIYGDLGYLDAYTLPALQKDFQQSLYQMVIHSGDFAYDLNSNAAMVGDEFMNQIETIAASVPYMTCPGNHEVHYNFSNYLGRFHSEQFDGSYYDGVVAEKELASNSWFSFDVGLVHYVSINTEVFFDNAELIDPQMKWLEEDLQEAKANGMPWIIVYGHRPFYCSPDDQGGPEGTFCRSDADLLRSYLEEPFMRNGVTFYFAGHVHSYEATYSVYNGNIVSRTFDDLSAPFYITGGAAGNNEGKINYEGDAPAFSRIRTRDFGYGLLTVHNATHLEYTQRGIDESTIDHIVITRRG